MRYGRLHTELMPLRKLGLNRAVATGSNIQPAIDDFDARKTCRIRVECLDPVATAPGSVTGLIPTGKFYKHSAATRLSPALRSQPEFLVSSHYEKLLFHQAITTVARSSLRLSCPGRERTGVDGKTR